MKIAFVFICLIALLALEVLDIFLLTKSIKTIKESKEDGKIDDEEKENIIIDSIQVIVCTVAVILGFIVSIHYLIS